MAIFSMLIKQSLREKICLQRKNLNSHEISYAAQKIFNQILKINLLQSHHHIAFYFATNGELDPAILMQYCLRHQKKCYTPILNQGTLSFCAIDQSSTLRPNKFGIFEPLPPHHIISPHSLDLIFMPLVGFDSKGNRLGMGGGFYDKTLAGIKAPQLVGLAYEFQKFWRIPTQKTDIKLSRVITEKNYYHFTG